VRRRRGDVLMPDLRRNVDTEYPGDPRGACFAGPSVARVKGRQLMASLLEDLHSVAAEPSEQEEFWRREFEYAGYAAVKRIVSGTIGWDEPRRQFALRWLREKESEVVRREKQMQLDATRIEKDIEQLQQDLAELQRDTGRLLEGATRLLEDKAQMQRDTRQMLWGSVAAVVMATLSLCVSMGHLFDGRDKTPMDLLQSTPTTFYVGAATAEANRVDHHDQAPPPFRREGRRRVDRNTAP
jgi:hypothetical protein